MALWKLKKQYIWFLIGLNLLALSMGCFLIYKKDLGLLPLEVGSIAGLSQGADFADPMMYSLEPLSTNLGGGGDQFIWLKVNLEVLGQESLTELKAREGVIIDTLIGILNEKSFDELETIQGKLRLKDQMMVQVNKFLPNGVVQNIYFSEFAVQ